MRRTPRSGSRRPCPKTHEDLRRPVGAAEPEQKEGTPRDPRDAPFRSAFAAAAAGRAPFP